MPARAEELLERIAVALERLAELVEIQVLPNSRKVPEGQQDASEVLYTDDLKIIAEDLRKAGWKGPIVGVNESLPGPLDENGREWTGPTGQEDPKTDA